jgi:hypothetical protein
LGSPALVNLFQSVEYSFWSELTANKVVVITDHLNNFQSIGNSIIIPNVVVTMTRTGTSYIETAISRADYWDQNVIINSISKVERI